MQRTDREGGQSGGDHAHPSNFRLILHKEDHDQGFGPVNSWGVRRKNDP